MKLYSRIIAFPNSIWNRNFRWQNNLSMLHSSVYGINSTSNYDSDVTHVLFHKWILYYNSKFLVTVENCPASYPTFIKSYTFILNRTPIRDAILFRNEHTLHRHSFVRKGLKL
jgi:hypothetical protein